MLPIQSLKKYKGTEARRDCSLEGIDLKSYQKEDLPNLKDRSSLINTSQHLRSTPTTMPTEPGFFSLISPLATFEIAELWTPDKFTPFKHH